MASSALSVCFLFLAPGPELILPWTFSAEGLWRTGGGRLEVVFELRCKFVLAVTFTTLLLPSACAPHCLNSNEESSSPVPCETVLRSPNPPRLPHRAVLNLKCNEISCVKWKHQWNKSQAVYDHRWANISHLVLCHMGILSSLGG